MSRSEAPHLPRGFDVAGPESHFGWSLLVGTGVASPVLLSALTGHQDVPSALALYLVAIAASWLAIGLLAGAFALVGPDAEELDAADESGPGGGHTPAASTPVATSEAGDPDPVATTQ